MTDLVPDYGEPKKQRRRRKPTADDISIFLKQYGRKSPGHGREPNDRRYDHDIAEQIKRMSPEELDRLMSEDETTDPPVSPTNT